MYLLLPRTEKEKIRIFQLTGALFFLLSVVTILPIIPIDNVGYIPLRVALTLLNAVMVILPLVNQRFAEKYIQWVTFVWIAFTSTFLFYLLHITNVAGETIYLIPLLSLLITVLPFSSFALSLGLNVFVTFGSAISVFLASETLTNPFIVGMYLLITFLITTYVQYLKSFLSKETSDTKLITENNPNPIMEVSLLGTLEYYNEAAKRMFDIKKDTLPAVVKFYREIAEKLEENNLEFLNRRIIVDGKYYDQKVTLTPDKDSLRFYIADITSTMQAATELKNTKEKLEMQQTALMNVLEDLSEDREFEANQSKTLVENIVEGIVVTNEEGIVTYTNPAFKKMIGYKDSDIMSKQFSAVIQAFDLNEKELDPLLLSNSAALTATSEDTKLIIQTKKGEKMPVVMSASPIYVQSKFRGVVRIIHDFSEDLKLAQQKDDFFSIASHELRTPLTVISGNLDIILQGYGNSKLSSDDKQLLEDTVLASDRLIKMVNDFLNVSRLDQGRLKYTPIELDPWAIAESVVKELTPLADEKGIKLIYKHDKSTPTVMGDDGLLKEIIINLLGNSIKFTDKGSVTLEAITNKNIVEMRVIDTGIGIEKSKQRQLFQRFQQAMSRTLAREAGGTGLGLYISRQFAQKMGGDLILEKSKYKKGTTFLLTIPVIATKSKADKTS